MINKVRFIKRIIGFIVGFVLILIAIDLLSFTDTGDDVLGRVFFATGYRNIGSAQICPAIEKVERKDGYSKIILGDSVCNQVFNGFQDLNEKYLLLGTNQAITMDGQYILARVFLESHPNATDVYLIMLPNAFMSGYDSEMSYSYLIEPFGKTEKLNVLSNQTILDMSECYGKLFLRKNVISFIDESCINNKVFLFYNQARIKGKEHNSNRVVSEETVYYLSDLQKICADKGVNLHILPCPIVDTDENHRLVEKIKNESDSLFDNYLECVTFYPEEMFQDGVHFGGEYENKNQYQKCIQDLSCKSKGLDGFVYQ